MKGIYKLLLAIAIVMATVVQIKAQVTYCDSFGQTLSDGSRGWSATNFTVLGTTTSIDVKVGGAAIIAAGNLYRGVANPSSIVNVYQTKSATIVLDKGTASFNWIHFVAYADWNADGTFDPSTELLFYDSNNSNANRTYTISVPETATLGQTRIRIIMGWFTQNTNSADENYYSPCFLVGSVAENKVPKNARAFDFLVNIQGSGQAVKPELLSKITEATALKSSTTEGTAVFQYTTANRTSLQNAIDAAQTVYNNTAAAESEVTASTSTLTNAIYNYKVSQNMPFKASDGITDYWYQIHDSRSPNVYWNVATLSTTSNALNRTTTSDPISDNQLFRMVKAPYPTLGYYIYSKTNATSPLVAPTTANGDIVRIEAGQTAATWTFDVAGTGCYLIKKESDSRQLNSYSDKISFWDGGAGDPGNNWAFVEALPVYRSNFTLKRTEARTLYNTTSTGTGFGQFTVGSRATFDAAIDAEEAKNADVMTLEQLKTGIALLASATSAYNLSIHDNFVSTESAPKWIYIKNYYYPTKVITTNEVVADGALKCQDKCTSTDAELWRFEYNADKTGVKIISKAQSTLAIKNSGQSTAALLKPNASATDFVISKTSYGLAIGAKGGGAYDNLHCDQYSNLVGWSTDGAATSWTFEMVPTFSGSGNWSDVVAWNNGAAPSTTATVIIDGDVTVNSNVSLAGLTLNSGRSITVAPGKQLTVTTAFTNNGTLTLQSDTTGTATVLMPAAVTGSGTANVQQFLPRIGTARNWYMSSPVVAADTTMLSLATSVKYWDEPSASWKTPAANLMNPAQGYVSVHSKLTGNQVTFTGTLNNGNVTVPLTYTAGNPEKPGFNLIGNPYPSYIKWSSVYSANTTTANMPTATMWYRTKQSGTWAFATVNGAGDIATPNTVSDTIPPMQAFWVRTQVDGSTINFNNAMRLHHSSPRPNLLKAPAARTSDRQLVRLQVSNGTNADEAVIYTDANAQNGLDAYDSHKMMNNTSEVPDIYTVAGAEQLVINGMNSLPLDTEIPLGFAPGKAGSFTLGASKIANLPSDVQVILQDKLAGKEIDLSGVGEYSFESSSTATPSRFALVFRTPSVATSTPQTELMSQVVVSVNSNRQITVQLPTKFAGIANLEVYNALGQLVVVRQMSGSRSVLEMPLPAGVYAVKVTAGDVKCTQKVVVKK